MGRRGAAAVALLLLPGAAGLRAQGPAAGSAVRVVRAAEELRLDGIPDEPAWASADSITDFRQQNPVEGAPASERTVVRFLATAHGLWVAFWNQDRQAGDVRRTQLRRDADFDSDDYVALLLDPQFDRRSGYVFFVNPNGAIADGEVVNQEDIAEDWNGWWDARAHVGPGGWTAELVIPWQVLRYPRGAEAWGMNVGRYIRRTNEEALWRAWRRQQGFLFQAEEGALLVPPDLPPRRRFEGRPYLAGSVEGDARAFDGAGADSVIAPATADMRIGFDGKLAVAPTLNLDVTANTDFAQVEVDNQVVNLSRFPVFFPEKRDFFLEAAGTFALGAAARTQLFNSRRIGLAEDGSPVPIVAGLRLSGRVGPDRIGLMAARTGGVEDAFDVVARVKHDVLARGYVGAMATGQAGPGITGTRLGGGLDFNLPLVVGGQNLIPLGWVAVSDRGDSTRAASAWALTLDYPNDNADHVVNLTRIERGYDPALGFVRQDGIWRSFVGLRFFPRPHRWGIRRLRLTLLEADVTWSLEGRLDNAEVEVQPLGIEFESGDEFSLQYERGEDRPREPFEMVPGVDVPAGSYGWNRAEVRFESSAGRPVQVESGFSVGQFYDGSGEAYELAVAAAWAPHVIAAVEGEVQRVRLPGGNFTTRLFRLRFDYASSPRLNTTLFLQWNNESERLAVNARLHWIPRPGMDAYVVWNATWPTWLDGGVPWRRPLRSAAIGKFVYYFRI